MSRLSVTLHQEIGSMLSVVPTGEGMMVAFGKRGDEGAVFVTMPMAQAAVLLSKLTSAFMAVAPPPPPIDAGVVRVGDAARDVVAEVRRKLEEAGADLTAPCDDFGPMGMQGEPFGTALSNLPPNASIDQIRAAIGLGPLTQNPVETWTSLQASGGDHTGAGSYSNVLVFEPRQRV